MGSYRERRAESGRKLQRVGVAWLQMSGSEEERSRLVVMVAGKRVRLATAKKMGRKEGDSDRNWRRRLRETADGEWRRWLSSRGLGGWRWQAASGVEKAVNGRGGCCSCNFIW
ncbi:hypothetical protein AMTR_s00073p00179890 [Amborella trichopoda]|uniref:Uncharacterized protein n=1 Tax=Amborella trichopoda TaxID=13333 RepID=W1NRL6_AMBTC|nr:hypothetical protein AMTR_s00073p00179890 [Amborella trichopoda]